jgi:hypothetical protein
VVTCGEERGKNLDVDMTDAEKATQEAAVSLLTAARNKKVRERMRATV